MARRAETPHRHTVPNSSYASFPCFHEELKFKTNLLKCDTSEETPENARENFQVNVSMHDKLKMCFAEMETMKDQFDIRRKKVGAKKRQARERAQENSDVEKMRPDSSIPPGEKASRPLKETHPKESSFDTGKASAAPTNSENKFTAHLIRTSSKDSMDGNAAPLATDMSKSFEALSHSPAYEETYVSAAGHPLHCESEMDSRANINRRTVSDPFGDLGLASGRERVDGTFVQSGQSLYGGARPSFESHRDTSFNWRHAADKTRYDDLAQSKSAETRRSYDEWLQKLDEVNDISRSTLKRIRHLESEMTNLRVATDNLSCRQKPAKPFASRIPITSAGGALSTAYATLPLRAGLPAKRYCDKCTNTDIDLKFMDELLRHWKSKSSVLMSEPAEMTSASEPSRVTRRRLTTTIGRSVEIQTEFEQKSCQEKAISTEEDWPLPNDRQSDTTSRDLIQGLVPPKAQATSREVPKQTPSQMSILDMPNIESDQQQPRCFDSLLADGASRLTRTKTPEPIVEIYSDSDDTSFDDFEKNIYNQISRRAMIQSKLAARKEAFRGKAHSESLRDPLRTLRSSSTQTNNNAEPERPKPSVFEEEKAEKADTPEDTTSAATAGGGLMVPKNLRSTSKIVIERVRMNQKEKSEIVLKTDIDKEGMVRRTTEVKNRKFRPKEAPRNVTAFGSDNVQPMATKHLRKVNSDMNVCHSRSFFSRPVSAIDIPNSEFGKKKEDNFFNDKALSSIDIAAKSPVSEGYHSEYLDHSSNRIDTPSQEYLIEPPKSFQNAPPDYNEPWEEVSKSEVTNKMVNETMNAFKEIEKNQSGFLTLTNETVIDNTGKQTNITTKSRTIRKYKPKEKTKSSLDLSQPTSHHPVNSGSSSDLSRSRSASQFNLDRYNSLQPIDADPPLYYGQVLDDLPPQQHKTTRSLVPKEPSQPTMCNFSFVYNYDNNLVFRANFGLAKLPCFETNL